MTPITFLHPNTPILLSPACLTAKRINPNFVRRNNYVHSHMNRVQKNEYLTTYQPVLENVNTEETTQIDLNTIEAMKKAKIEVVDNEVWKKQIEKSLIKVNVPNM